MFRVFKCRGQISLESIKFMHQFYSNLNIFTPHLTLGFGYRCPQVFYQNIGIWSNTVQLPWGKNPKNFKCFICGRCRFHVVGILVFLKCINKINVTKKKTCISTRNHDKNKPSLSHKPLNILVGDTWMVIFRQDTPYPHVLNIFCSWIWN